MKNQCHIQDFAEPLLAFHVLKMRCGKVLENAEMVYARAMGESLPIPDVNQVSCCVRCLLASPIEEEARVYEYWLREKSKRIAAGTAQEWSEAS